MTEWLPTICEQTDRQSQAADRHRPTVRQNSYRQTDRQTVKRTDTHTNTDSKKSTSAQGRQKRHPYLHSLEQEIHSYSIWLLFCGSVRNILQKHQNQNTRNAQEKQVTKSLLIVKLQGFIYNLVMTVIAMNRIFQGFIQWEELFVRNDSSYRNRILKQCDCVAKDRQWFILNNLADYSWECPP